MLRRQTLQLLLLALVWPALERTPTQAGESPELFPSPSVPAPLLAAPREARTGLRKEIGSSRMRLDIGTVLDLVGVQTGSSWELRFGADIFAYGLTTSSEGLRLQVDAIDGFFGGHIALRHASEARTFAVRLRILHHSAHFVDGHYDLSRDEWKGGAGPNPYTRDAGELLLLLGHRWDATGLDLYAGAEYATFMRPDDMTRWNFLGGIQAHTQFAQNVLGAPASAYLAYNLGVEGIPAYVATHTVNGGVKFGRWEERGLRLYAEFTAGLEPYGQYYTVRREHWGLGFALDIW